MRKGTARSAVCSAAVLFLVCGGRAVAGDVVYHGGPVLETFTIAALYWGAWTKKEMDTKQTYLKNLAAYMNGDHAPAGEEPVIQQYGITKVSVDDKERTADTNSSCIQLVKNATCDIPRNQIAGPRGGSLLDASIIHQAQTRKDDPLPRFGPHTLIVVFVPHQYVLTNCAPFPSCGGAYHASESTTECWAVISGCRRSNSGVRRTLADNG